MAGSRYRRERALALLILLDLIDDETQQSLLKRRKKNTWVRSWIKEGKNMSVIIIL